MLGIENLSIAWYALCKGNLSEAAHPPPEGKKKPSDHYERRVITMYITLADLIQFCLLLVTLVVACYTIFKDKED